jgi:hypothetical protein
MRSIDPSDSNNNNPEDNANNSTQKASSTKKKPNPQERENSLFNRVGLQTQDEIHNMVVRNRNQLMTFEQSELKFMHHLKRQVMKGLNGI